ncbi:MAG: polyprenyl diphosphate synthase [Candidatus Eremiobacteraeota bacterium]|nr:polyprenyl diphosphate synthase [Candidatus Eremiobacteraeota bacterium]
MHVAVIMDGNRRWARANGLPLIEGYRRGVISLRNTAAAALAHGVSRLTVYGFSTENWHRAAVEVDLIMQVCVSAARGELRALGACGVRVETIGDLDAFALPVRAALRDLVKATANNRGMTLALALNYSGRAEIVRAAKAIATDVARGCLSVADIDETAFRERMYAPYAPDPDLLIRTGGDLRVSNFLLYQIAYTELLALPTLWPDFDQAVFAEAVRGFGDRQRRFGA